MAALIAIAALIVLCRIRWWLYHGPGRWWGVPRPNNVVWMADWRKMRPSSR